MLPTIQATDGNVVVKFSSSTEKLFLPSQSEPSFSDASDEYFNFFGETTCAVSRSSIRDLDVSANPR